MITPILGMIAPIFFDDYALVGCYHQQAPVFSTSGFLA
jgi:hypothetical protein